MLPAPFSVFRVLRWRSPREDGHEADLPEAPCDSLEQKRSERARERRMNVQALSLDELLSKVSKRVLFSFRLFLFTFFLFSLPPPYSQRHLQQLLRRSVVRRRPVQPRPHALSSCVFFFFFSPFGDENEGSALELSIFQNPRR